MKKLLTLLVCFLTFLGASAVEPTQVFQLKSIYGSAVENETIAGVGINAEGRQVCVSVEPKGNDAVFTIYKTGFSVDKIITIKNAYGVSDADGYTTSGPYRVHCFNFDDRDWHALAIQGLGADASQWYVFIGAGDGERGWIKIYDETGNHIYNYLRDFDYYIDGSNEVYLVDEDSEEDYDNDIYTETFTFFDFRGGSGVNAPVAVKKTSRAYPNPLYQGRQFTIELSEAAPEGTTVIVSDMNGATLYTTEVRAGAEKVVIPSRKLRNGNLVYSVISGGNILEKGKIIVR